MSSPVEVCTAELECIVPGWNIINKPNKMRAGFLQKIPDEGGVA